jgi:hypothetical protein
VFPRYFLALTDPEPVGAIPTTVDAHLLDVLRLRRVGGVREVAVLRDLRGDLHLVDVTPALPVALRAAIHQHELAAGLRTLAVDEVWLLDVDALEQLPDTPGTNDPIYLTGTLSGPWPEAPRSARGRVALTRADWLAGVTAGEPHAVRAGEGRCLHAAIPVSREDELAAGRGYALAFALVPREIQPSEPSNEGVVAQLVHDVLGALRADLQAAKVAHWLVREKLPVPSRSALEAELVADGWKIRGNSAVRPLGPNAGLSGFLSMALGVDWDRRILLPKEAPLGAFLDLARKMLVSFDDFPDARANALARRVEGVAVAPPRSAQAAPLTGAIALPTRPAGEREEWEAHFRRPASSPGLGARVTPVRRG